MKSQKIYGYFSGQKFPQDGEINGTQYIGDFLNHNINFHYNDEIQTFEELGRMYMMCIKYPGYKAWLCQCKRFQPEYVYTGAGYCRCCCKCNCCEDDE